MENHEFTKYRNPIWYCNWSGKCKYGQISNKGYACTAINKKKKLDNRGKV